MGPRSLQSDIGGFPISGSVRYRLSQIFVLSARLWKRRPVPQSLLRIFENCCCHPPPPPILCFLAAAWYKPPSIRQLHCWQGHFDSRQILVRMFCATQDQTTGSWWIFFQLWSASRISRPQHDSALLTVHIQLLVGPLLALVVK